MKRLVLILLVALSSVSYAQRAAVTADMVVNLGEVTDLNGKAVSGSKLSTGDQVTLRIPVQNMNQTSVVKAGSCRLEIDLGSKVSMAGGLDQGSSVLSNYFDLGQGVAASGGTVVTAKIKADLPADFTGTLVLKLQCLDAGSTEIKMHWVYADPKLRAATSHNESTFQLSVAGSTKTPATIANRK